MDQPGATADDHLTVLGTRFHSPDAYVLVLRGIAGLDNAEKLDNAFTQAIATGCPLVVDLAALSFADEMLLGLLITARKSRQVILVGPVAPVFRKRLATTGTEGLFTIELSLTQALSTLSP